VLIRLFIISLLAIISSNSYAACLGSDPITAAKVFYKKHQDFYYAKPSKNQGFLSTRLQQALASEYRCKDGVICALDFDPWTDAQDGDIGDPKSFKLISNSHNKAEVLMSYQFVLDQSRIEPKSLKIMLELQNQERCWVVSDLVSPSGHSVLATLETWQAKEGSSSNPSFKRDAALTRTAP
jgi:hypothetical protein